MSTPITAYISIGNSDDKLTQRDWAVFSDLVNAVIRRRASQVHGEWYSPSSHPWQNACWCAEFTPDRAELAKGQLAELARDYKQDSIAWAVARTEFLA